MVNKARDKRLDVIRTFAIIGVLMAHACGRVYGSFALKAMKAVSTPSLFFGCFVQIVGKAGVPLFFMLTGYLVLSREFGSSADILRFWKKKLLPLILTYEIWVVIYEVFGVCCQGKNFSLRKYVYRVFFMADSDMGHMWFMPAIIGIYLALPLASIVLHKIDLKVTSVLPYLFSAAFMVWSIRSKVSCSLTISFFMIPIGSLVFFILMLCVADRMPPDRLWTEVSSAAFGIYFVHYPVLLVTVSQLNKLLSPIVNPVEILIYFVVIFVVSLTAVEIITYLMPPVGRILFMSGRNKKNRT